MTNDGFHTYTYDAEGNILQVDGGSTASYTYDALNHRVRSQTGSTTYEYMYDYAGRRTSSWYNPSSGNPGTGNAGRIYWDNQEFAYRAANGQTYFDQRDFTGTIRMRTTYSGAVDTTETSLPFGDAWTLYPQSSNSNESYFDFATLRALRRNCTFRSQEVNLHLLFRQLTSQDLVGHGSTFFYSC
jgi:YD repeat-containing protein